MSRTVASVLCNLRHLRFFCNCTRPHFHSKSAPHSSGVEHGNLRELALQRMKDLGLKCRDVRTREVGITEIHEKVRPNDVELIRRDYYANGGWETFLSYEDPEQDILIALLRLRKCAEETTYRPELVGKCSIVRELHVYGSVVPVSGRNVKKFQHQGYGSLLMEKAEDIAIKEHKSEKIAVISGVGTRNYYRKLGYELEGPYMLKSLKPEVYKSVFSCVDGDPVPKITKPYARKKWTLDDNEWLQQFDNENS